MALGANAALFVAQPPQLFFDTETTKSIAQKVHPYFTSAENAEFRVHYHEGEIGYARNFIAADALQMLGLALPETGYMLPIANACILMRTDNKNLTAEQDQRILKAFNCALQPECSVGGCFRGTAPTDRYCDAPGCSSLICEFCSQSVCGKH